MWSPSGGGNPAPKLLRVASQSRTCQCGLQRSDHRAIIAAAMPATARRQSAANTIDLSTEHLTSSNNDASAY